MLKKLIGRLARPNHTWKRFFNGCLNYAAKKMALPFVPGMPESVLIEPTDACNLRCPLCPTGAGVRQRPTGSMSLENFCRIIDEIAPSVYGIALSNYGEAFLNRDLTAMIRYAKAKRLEVNCVTNAQSIGPQEAREIVEAGLDVLTVSLDGYDQQSYAAYRVGGEFSKVVEGLRLIKEQKAAQKRAAPVVVAQCIVMKQNEAHLGEIEKLARELGARRLVLKRLCDLRAFPASLDGMKELLPRDPKYRAYTQGEDGSVRWNVAAADRDFCPLAWDFPAINWDGTLFPCCFICDGLAMGNVFESGFAAAWNSLRFRQLRARIKKGKGALPVCGRCAVNFYGELIRGIEL